MPGEGPFNRWGGALFDALSGPPSGSFWSKWIGGVAAPIVAAAFGVAFIVRQAGAWPGVLTGGGKELEGGPAVAAGIGLVGLAVFLHFHFYWGASPRLANWAQAGKLAGCILFAAGILYMVGSYLIGFSR